LQTATKLRAWVIVTIAGVAGAVVRPRYTTDLTGATGWTDITGMDISIATVNNFGIDSAIIDVPSGCKTQEFVLLTVAAALGDGVGDPQIAYFRVDWLDSAIVTGEGSGVDSFNGRTGTVVPVSGDYTADQVTDTSAKVLMTPAERTKLAGIATGATVAAVTSVFSRTGAVTAQSGDYTAAQVGAPTTAALASLDARVVTLEGAVAGATTFSVVTAAGALPNSDVIIFKNTGAIMCSLPLPLPRTSQVLCFRGTAAVTLQPGTGHTIEGGNILTNPGTVTAPVARTLVRNPATPTQWLRIY